MPPPWPNPRTALWCCAARLSQSARASRPTAPVPPSRGCAPAPGCAAFRSSIISPCAAFFRLASLAHGRLIAVKAGVLIPDGMAGITKRFEIGDLLVVGLARIGPTQIPHSPGLGMDDHHILVAVGLGLATVVQDLFFWTFRARAAALRAIDDQFPCLSFAACLVSKLAWPAFGHHLQGLQGLLEQGQ